MKGHERYRPKEPPDLVVKGARLLFGIFIVLWVLIGLLVWAAVGSPLPDWQFPCPAQDSAQTPSPD